MSGLPPWAQNRNAQKVGHSQGEPGGPAPTFQESRCGHPALVPYVMRRGGRDARTGLF